MIQIKGVDDEEEHRLYRATIGDGNALAVDVNPFPPHLQPATATRSSTNAHHAACLAVEHCD